MAVPARVLQAPSMLSLDERRLLYRLGHDAAEKTGRIVDAGYFLGGSTIALAQGLADGGCTDRRIDVYDRFTVERYSAGWFDGLKPGDSFLPAFERNIAGLEHLCRVHAGDIRAEPFPEPIDVLFLDVLKTTSIHDAVVPRAFAQLRPGSVVVQQDYYSGSVPWIVVTMERLAECFERSEDVSSSAVFVCTAPPPPERLARISPWDLLPRESLAYFDRALDAATDEHRALLLVAKAQQALMERSGRQARRLLAEVDRDHDSPEVRSALERARGAQIDNLAVIALSPMVRGPWNTYRHVRRNILGPPP